jgi:hypothetical protein
MFPFKAQKLRPSQNLIKKAGSAVSAGGIFK